MSRIVLGTIAALVVAVAFALVPTGFAAPNDPVPKASGEHITYVYCHRTGSASNPFVVIGTDDAAWAEAHFSLNTPHPPQGNPTDNDDILIAFGVGISAKDYSKDDCDPKDPPPPDK